MFRQHGRKNEKHDFAERLMAVEKILRAELSQTVAIGMRDNIALPSFLHISLLAKYIPLGGVLLDRIAREV